MSGSTMRYIIGISFAALVLWALQATGILMAVAVFLMVGVIPGTSISIPPSFMLALLVVLALCIAYWTVRQRPIRQIKELKNEYEKTTFVANITPQTQPAAPREAIYTKGFDAGFLASHRSVYRARRRLIKNIIHGATVVGRFAMRVLLPLFKLSVVIAITSKVAAREFIGWAKPRLKQAISWLKIQARYSLKGTASFHSLRRVYKKIRSFLPKISRK